MRVRPEEAEEAEDKEEEEEVVEGIAAELGHLNIEAAGTQEE